MAFFASFVTAHRYASLCAECRFFELKGQIFAQISATLNPAASAAATRERVSEAEKFTENISEILKVTGIETAA
jgi:hypothetical protein